ncbi:MAG TPA: hypothetical protein VKI19_03285 [Acidimicrobiales bacterium]|nr:hypothetical protein [Acidimicrobiales bacterium]
MTAVAEPLSSQAAHRRREERLLRLLERASASSRFNLGERWLFALGGALVVGGIVAVIIGWVGTSRTVLVAGQIPYLVSGGLLGLGLIFLGSFLYFGHWVAVLVRESRERGAEDREDLALVRQSLEDIHRSLATVAGALAATATASSAQATSSTVPAAPAGVEAAPAAAPSSHEAAAPANGSGPYPMAGLASMAAAAGDETAPVLLATETGSMAHRPGCRALAGKPNLRSVSLAEGYKPCGMCRPLDVAGLQ